MTFRNKADIGPFVVMILSFTVLMATWVFIENPLIGLAINLLLLLPRAMATTFVHNHAHLPTFREKPANFALETILYFLSGMMSSKFKLHHNLGHHLHYLDSTKDPSKWVYANGKIMPRWVYTLRYYFTHTYFSVKIGLANRKFLNEYFIQQAWFLLLVIGLFVFKPLTTLYLIFIPMTVTWLLFITITYDDHVGLFSENPLEASFTKTGRFVNRVILNNGYHTAHHLKPGLHWSELPTYHETLLPDMPDVEAHTFLNRLEKKHQHA